ncbi:MAG: cation:proton antiporter, partial [Deltaproteobacteria bacterium]|nr:cation:proton antiporter [Deltaproteobacteria bacterium]
MTLIAIYCALIFFYSLVSKRLERTVITAPLLFTVAGGVALLLIPELRGRDYNFKLLLQVAEIGLVLLLFTDASKTDLAILKSIRALPLRLLSTGMLLTIVLGALAAVGVFPNLTIWEAGILGAILAPTDAGLGQIIVSSPRVPKRIRQALNVEAGLNDGLSVPFMLFFIALAESGAAGQKGVLGRFIMEQLGYGALIGIGIGLAGGLLVGLAHRRQWMA